MGNLTVFHSGFMIYSDELFKKKIHIHTHYIYISIQMNAFDHLA